MSILKEIENKISLYCESRADIDLELIPLMQKAGCISLDFALESGSKKVLKAIRKNIKLEQVLPFAQACHKAGIRNLVFAMVSLPEEKEEDAEMTLNMIAKLQPYICTIATSALIIYPGTELERKAREKGILPREFSWYDTSFKNPHPDLVSECLPMYIEHLTPDWIRDVWFPTLKQIRYKYFIGYDRVFYEIKKTLFDWKHDTMTKKVRRISSGVDFIKAKATPGHRVSKCSKPDRRA